MILSNVEIHKALDEGRLIIKPEPLPRTPEQGPNCPYDTHSVDLRLSPYISIPLPGPYSYDLMQPGSFSEFITRNSERRTITQEGFALKQSQFLLGQTLEYIALPLQPDQNGCCLAARVEGKSSRARCGVLVHFTAPTVHPGFEGQLTLEIINLGPVPFVLRPEMPIAQLIIEEVKGLPFKKESQFQGQLTPEGKSG